MALIPIDCEAKNLRGSLLYILLVDSTPTNPKLRWLKRLEVGVRRRAGEHTALSSTGVVGCTTGKEDVTSISPGGSPRVLDLVEVNAVKGSVTDGEDTVVKFSTAGTGENTRLVQLEVLLVGLDGDRHGVLGKGRHHGRVRVLLHVSVRHGGRVGHGSAGLGAGTGGLGGTRGIRVRGLGTDASVGGGPLEGVVHKTSVAAHVGSLGGSLAVVAINELLLRERNEVLVLVEVSSLHGTSGGERPARAALALVLDRGDGTQGGPVNGGGDVLQVRRSLVGELGRDLRLGKAKADVLGVLSHGEVGELVVAKLVRLAGGVVGVDVVLIVGEVLEHLHEVHAVNGLDLVGLEPVKELLLVEGAVMHVGRHGGGLNIWWGVGEARCGGKMLEMHGLWR